MNYLKELNAFYVRLETEPLTASAIALWHALMHVNNRTRWVERFSVAATVLCVKTNLPVSTFKRARAELKRKGLIRHVSRGKLSPFYEMVSLVVDDEAASEKEAALPVKAEQADDERDVVLETDVQEVDVVNATGEQKTERKLSITTFMFFMDSFPNESRRSQRELHEWAEVMGDELVYQAIARAVENEKDHWRYVRGILMKWYRDGLFTVSAVVASEASYRLKRYGGLRRKEVLPEWFKRGREDG